MGYKLWKLSGESSTANHKTDIYAEILASRGFQTPEAAETLADASLSDPFLIKDMDKAVERIQEAIESGETIAVYGDYDCDGVCATAILVSYLETTGAEVVPYIPSREGEGYGMNRQAVKTLVEDKGASLIITVDNGINSVDEIAYAKQLGADVVVTDHHQQKAVLPAAAAVVDTHRQDDRSPYKFMCGAGIAFKLVTAIEGCEYDEMLEYYGDIAALATVGDVVPLTGENRALVRRGLKNISETQNIGLAALIDVCGLGDKPITAETAAFTLVPRINAAGRLGSADTALEMLLTDDPERASELAGIINDENKKRQHIETEIVKAIADDIDKNPALVQQRVIVLAGEGWHHGVIGIVASRLVERYGKPCFLISVDGETGVSSGRGVEGYSLFEALDACGELLVRYGGHSGAAGFTIEAKNIDKFIKAINKYSAKQYEYMPPNILRADIECEPYDVRVSDIEKLAVLEPFGCENEPVRYLFKNARLKK